MSAEAFQALVLPIALGLVGFIEPCSLGSTFLFLKVMEGKPAAAKASQVAVFALVRGLVMGLLGTAAAFIGSAFFGFQLAGRGRDAPVWTGLVLLALGVWSAWYGLYASIEPPP